MTLTESIVTCLSKYADFSGRASRSEYWYFCLFNGIASSALLLIPWFIGFFFGIALGPRVFRLAGLFEILDIVFGIAYAIFQLGMIVPYFAVATRRLHDINKSGWWQLLHLAILIGSIVLVAWFAMAGEDKDNQYGRKPLK